MSVITSTILNPDNSLTVTVQTVSERIITLPAAEATTLKGGKRRPKPKQQLLTAIKRAVRNGAEP